jgi:hypothetical protein
MGYTYTTKVFVYLKFKCIKVSCILSSDLRVSFCKLRLPFSAWEISLLKASQTVVPGHQYFSLDPVRNKNSQSPSYLRPTESETFEVTSSTLQFDNKLKISGWPSSDKYLEPDHLSSRAIAETT